MERYPNADLESTCLWTNQANGYCNLPDFDDDPDLVNDAILKGSFATGMRRSAPRWI